jgi:hypothetical protein
VIEEPGEGRGPGLDLGRRRTLGQLLAATVGVYRSHLGTVLASTSAIVVVVAVIEGIGLKQITGPYQEHVKQSVAIIQILISFFVLMPLVNAMQALLLGEIGAGRSPRLREIVVRALELFAPALVAAVIYAAAMVAGFFALFIPGVWILVLCFFCTQAVVIEGRRGFAALLRSGELVAGKWFRVMGTLVVVWVLGSVVPTLVAGIAVDAVAKALDVQFVAFVGDALIEIVTLSFVAVAAGLLFFELRAARAAAA